MATKPAPRPEPSVPTQTLSFTMEKETKNTIRYTEQTEAGKPPAIGTLYVQKWLLGQDPPKTATVTVTFS